MNKGLKLFCLSAIGLGYPDEIPQVKPRIKEKIRYVK